MVLYESDLDLSVLFLAIVGETRDCFSATYRPVSEAKSLPNDPPLDRGPERKECHAERLEFHR